MHLLLGIVMALLATIDMGLTYEVIESNKGHEAEPFGLNGLAAIYIKNKPLTVIITAAGIALIILLTWEAPLILLLPIAAFGYACWNNWRVLNAKNL